MFAVHNNTVTFRLPKAVWRNFCRLYADEVEEERKVYMPLRFFFFARRSVDSAYNNICTNQLKALVRILCVDVSLADRFLQSDFGVDISDTVSVKIPVTSKDIKNMEDLCVVLDIDDFELFLARILHGYTRLVQARRQQAA